MDDTTSDRCCLLHLEKPGWLIGECSRRWMLLVFVSALCGCGRRGDGDLLEARLRQQEDRLAQMQSHLTATESELATARSEAVALRRQLADRGENTILPEQANVLYRIHGIHFNRLLTGGLDRDRSPGDELLTAVLVPHDEDGELLKLPGNIQLEVLDLSKPQASQRIGTWEFNVDESRSHWHSGFFGSGYMFRLPWQQLPDSSKLLLHARMTTTDGRQFDISQTIRITPPEKLANLPKHLPPRKLKTAEDDRHQPELFRRTSIAQQADENQAPFRRIPGKTANSETKVIPWDEIAGAEKAPELPRLPRQPDEEKSDTPFELPRPEADNGKPQPSSDALRSGDPESRSATAPAPLDLPTGQ